MSRPMTLMFRMRILLPAILFAAALTGGCSDDPKADAHGEGSLTQRQDDAMKDPFSYGPNEGKTQAPTDSNGVTKRDDSLKGQMDRFWNP